MATPLYQFADAVSPPDYEALNRRALDHESMFLDTDNYLASLPAAQKTPLDAWLSWSPDPAKDKRTAVVKGYLADVYSLPDDQITNGAHTIHRDRYAREVLGVPYTGNLDDDSFFQLVKAERQKGRETRIQAESFQAAAVADALKLTPSDPMESEAKMQESANSIEGAKLEDAARYFNSYRLTRANIEAKAGPLRPVAREVFALLSKGKQERFGDDSQTAIETAIDKLAELPEDQRGYVVAMLQAEGGTDTSGNTAEKTTGAAIRGIAGQLRGIASNVRRQGILAFQSGNAEIYEGMTPEKSFQMMISGRSPGMSESRATRKPTEAEAKTLKALADKALTRSEVAQQAINILEGTIDPINTKGMAQKVAVNVGSSLGAMAPAFIPYAGLVIQQGAFADQEYQRQRSLGTDPQTANTVAQITGTVQAGLDRVQALFAIKLPGLAAAAPLATNAAARVAGAVAGVQAAEYTIESAQDAVPIFTAKLAEGLGLPTTTAASYAEELKRWKVWNPEMFMTLLPLSLVGGGYQGIQNTTQARQQLSALMADPASLQAVGIAPAEAARIAALPEAERAPAYQAAYASRDPSTPEAAAAQQTIADRTAASIAEGQAAIEEMQEAGLSITRTPEGYAVMDTEAGTTINTPDATEAMTLARGIMTERGIQKDETFLDALDEFTAIMREGRTIELTSRTGSLLQELETAEADGKEKTVAAIWDRADEYRASQGEEALARDMDNPDSRNALEGLLVLGRSTTQAQGNAARSISLIMQGGGTLDLVEEQAENDLREAVAAGKTTLSTMRGILKRIEAATGDKYINTDTETETGITEAWSSLVRIYTTGTRKEGNRITAGARKETAADLRALRRRLKEAEGNGTTPGAFSKLREYYEQLKAMLGQVSRLMKLKAEGKLDDVEAMIRESVGLKEQDAHETAVVEAVPVDYNLPDGWDNTEDVGFSVTRRAQPAEASKRTVLPDGAELIGPTSFSITTADRLRDAKENPGNLSAAGAELSFDDSGDLVFQSAPIAGRLGGEANRDYITVSIRAPLPERLPDFSDAQGLAEGNSYATSFSLRAKENYERAAAEVPSLVSAIGEAERALALGGGNPPLNRQWSDFLKNLRRDIAANYVRPQPGDRFLYNGKDATVSENGEKVVYGPGKWDNDPVSWIDDRLITTELIRQLRAKLTEAEVKLFFAEEEFDPARAQRLADKETAGEWARRTRAAEFAAILDARDEEAAKAGRNFLAQIWGAFAQHDEVFQFGRTDSKSAVDIAAAVSAPGREITAQEGSESIRFESANGSLSIRDADTRTPWIRSDGAESKGKKGGGGSQLYAAALDWIHNNGKRIKDDDGGLTDINAIRRTSNFLASALRWGTTKHLKPHDKQQIKWGRSNHLNIAALATTEMGHAFKAIAKAKEWSYDFTSGQFRDNAGNNLTRADFDAAVSLGDPEKSGIGLSTLQRAVITQSAIRAFERGETSQSLLGAQDAGVAPAGVSYAITTADRLEAVASTLATKARDPEQRFKMYEAARERLSGMAREIGFRDDVAEATSESAAAALEARQANALAVLENQFSAATQAREAEQTTALESIQAEHATAMEALNVQSDIEAGGAQEDGWTADQKDALKVRQRLALAKLQAKQKAETTELKTKHQRENDTAATKERQSIKRLKEQQAAAVRERENITGAQAQRRDMLRFLQALDTILMPFPAEVRGKVGGFVKLAGLRTNAAMESYLKKRVEKLDSVLETHMRKEYTEAMGRLLKKAEPTKGKPGEKMAGKLGPDVQHLMDKVRESLAWTAEEVVAHIAGLDSKIMGGTLTPEQEALALREIELVQLAGDWTHADAAQRSAALKAATETYEGGYLEWAGKLVAKRERRAAVRSSLIVDTGKAGTETERDARAQADLGWWGKAKDFFLSLSSFEEVARYVFGDSAAARAIVDAERTAAYAYEDAQTAMADAVQSHFTALAKGSHLGGEKLRYRLSQKSITTAKKTLSEMEAIQAILLWNQPDGQRHMIGHLDENGQPSGPWHYDQAWIDEVTAAMTPEGRATLAFIQRTYAAEWATLNPLYRERHGVNLPRHENYAPVTVTPVQAKAGEMVDPVSGQAMAGSILTPGSLRTRSRTAIAEPEFRDALQTLLAHTAQMEHWKAYYDFAVEANAVLGNREVSNAVTAAGGKQSSVVLRKWIDHFAQGGTRDAGAALAANKALSTVSGRAARMALVGRVGTLMIQSTQLGASLAEMPTGAYLSRMGKLLAGRLSWGDALRSDYIQRRIQQMPPIVREALAGLDTNNPNAIKHAVNRLGQLISGADGLFTAGTYAILLDYHRAEAGKQGFTGPEADNYAHEQAIRSTERVAQPTRAGTRSLFENTATSPLSRLGWAFASEARQKIALAAWAASNAKASPARAARVALVVWGAGGLMAAAIRSAWKDLRDDDDEELFDERNWSLKQLIAATLSGPLQGIPGLGEAMQSAVAKATGTYDPGGNLLSSLGRSVPAAKDILTGDFMESDEPVEDTMKDVEAILTAAGLANDTIAAATSIMHLVRDGANILDGLRDDPAETEAKAKRAKAAAKKEKAEAKKQQNL